ncbi:hypothetical protein BIW11_04908 [Tropilaelaps mercedesae]|uniref:Uncharacterized protein n=1 Tax=Tropilaelaps mercedesae TaxID=418985 RepID=A0A1V9WZW4_9ACAR|nr:hypothetical protein BIW11_04908 [Tropilaelaps mercedesae]
MKMKKIAVFMVEGASIRGFGANPCDCRTHTTGVCYLRGQARRRKRACSPRNTALSVEHDVTARRRGEAKGRLDAAFTSASGIIENAEESATRKLFSVRSTERSTTRKNDDVHQLRGDAASSGSCPSVANERRK